MLPWPQKAPDLSGKGRWAMVRDRHHLHGLREHHLRTRLLRPPACHYPKAVALMGWVPHVKVGLSMECLRPFE